MNKEVKTIKKNKSTKNKNDVESNLVVQIKNNNQNNNENNINRSKSIKLEENSKIEISNNIEKKEIKKNNLGQFFTTDISLQKKLIVIINQIF